MDSATRADYNITLNGTSYTNPDLQSSKNGVIIVIVMSAILIIVISVIFYHFFVRKNQRQVTLTMRRAQRIRSLDVLHIDVEYSNTSQDSPTTDRLSCEGYTNLVSNNLFPNQDFKSTGTIIPTGKDVSDTDGVLSVISNGNFINEEQCGCNKNKDSDAIIPHPNSEVDENEMETKCFSEDRIEKEAIQVPPVRFDIESISSGSSEIEISLVRKSENTNEKQERNDEKHGTASTIPDCSVYASERNTTNLANNLADNDQMYLIERQNISYENEGMEDNDLYQN